MSGIKFECKKAIGKINALIRFYKPVDKESIYFHFEYLQEVKTKVEEVRDCLHEINQLNNTIVSEDDCTGSLLLNFDIFDDGDEFIYNEMFINELIELKEKIKKGLNSLP